MRFDILTIFPLFFGTATERSAEGSGIFGSGMLGEPLRPGRSKQPSTTYAISRSTSTERWMTGRLAAARAWSSSRSRFAAALRALGLAPRLERAARREMVILLSAQGRPFHQALAHELAGLERVVLLCGRYEGVDERVSELLADREISIGDYVLTGGELGAAVIIDAVTRLVPGVLGNAASRAFESFGAGDAALASLPQVAPRIAPRATHGAGGLLDYPQYTRPAEFGGMAVPAVLMDGNHEQVRRWRRERALEKTWRHRPDLLQAAELSPEDQRFLATLSR